MNKYAEYSRSAQLDRVRRNTCLQKKAYRTFEEAFQKGQDVYRCRFCKLYHRSGQAAELGAALRKKLPVKFLAERNREG